MVKQLVIAFARGLAARSRPSSTWRALSSAIVLSALASCAVAPATQVMVFVDAEPAVRSATAVVEVIVEGSTGRGAADFAQRQLSEVTPSWPIRIALAPLDGDSQRVYRVTARALDGARPTGMVVAEVRAVSGYRPGETVRIDLVFQDACLHHAPCADDETCSAGLCSPAMIDPMTLAPIDSDAGRRDASAADVGLDAGPDDAGPVDDAGHDAAIDGGIAPPIEEAMLVAADGVPGDQFGTVAISADGTRALVGAPLDDVASHVDTGTVRVFVRSETSWTEETELHAILGSTGDHFGCAVALSSDATYALVGASGDDTGASTGIGSVRVFFRTGTAWAEQATLFGTGGAFGSSVAINADGTRALVGAPTDAAHGLGAGSAHVFIRVGTSWMEEQELVPTATGSQRAFGTSVALSADAVFALVGATHASDGGLGTATVFLRGGVMWAEQTRLAATDGIAGDSFGSAVALSSDGSRALVGAEMDDVDAFVDAGSAHVFARTGTTWVEEAELLAMGGAASEHLGASVALSAGGDRAVVSANIARTFAHVGATWSEGAPLPTTGADFVGARVALTADGARAVVGAPASVATTGSARVFLVSWP